MRYVHSLLNGRHFTAEEVRDGAQSAIVGQRLANELYPDGNALGQKVYFHFYDKPFIIVGISKNRVVYNEERTENDIYTPWRFDRFLYLMRFEQSAPPTRDEINSILKEQGVQHKVFELTPMKAYYSKQLNEQIFISGFVLAISLIAGVLGGLGIYGVLNYSIKLRAFELGVRMAIGAKKRDIIRLVAKDEARPVLAGILLSVCVTFLIFLIARQYVPSLESISLTPILATLAVVVGTVIVSTYIPLSTIVNRWPEKILKRHD